MTFAEEQLSGMLMFSCWQTVVSKLQCKTNLELNWTSAWAHELIGIISPTPSYSPHRVWEAIWLGVCTFSFRFRQGCSGFDSVLLLIPQIFHFILSALQSWAPRILLLFARWKPSRWWSRHRFTWELPQKMESLSRAKEEICAELSCNLVKSWNHSVSLQLAVLSQKDFHHICAVM